MGCNPKGLRRVSIGDAPVPYRTDKDGEGHAVSPRAENRPEIVLSGVVIKSGKIPCVVVYVRPTARDEKQFFRFCHATGCNYESDCDNPGSWLVVGHPDAIEQLVAHKVVIGWHYVIEAREPMSSGSGEDKPRSGSKAGPKTVAPEYTRKAQGLE
jgi:hypothetical protein